MAKYGKEISEILEKKMKRTEFLEMHKKHLSLMSGKLIKMIINCESNISITRYAKTLEENFNEKQIKEYKKNVYNLGDSETKYLIDREQMLIILKKLGLNGIEKRNIYKERVKELYELFLKMCDGDKEAYFKFNEKYEEYVTLRFDRNTVRLGKYIPFGLFVSLTDENPLNFESYFIKDLKLLKSYKANELIKEIMPEIEKLLGVKRKKYAKDIINEVKNLVVNEEDDSEEEIFEIETVETLKLEIEQYKSSLSLIQNNLNELTQNIEEETEMAVNEQIKEFFVSLNSGKYGNVLDKIPLTEELLKDIRKNNIEISQELKKILMFIKSIIKFIKDTGIVPIREMGNVFTGTAEDIAEMDYTGNEFREGEVKKLKVIAPGYKYKDIIISIPKVEEIEK